MSKKTRKKSPKSFAGKAARGQSSMSAKTSTKTPPSKTRPATANKPGKKANQQPAAAKPKAGNPLAGKLPAGKGKTAATAAGKPALAEGAKAPAFRLPRDGGGTVSLSDYSGKKLVLFFYPRADTPGCTREAIDFTRLSGAFAENETAILGVSADTLKAQEAFRNKHQLSTPLVSDERHEMLEAYGVWGEKSMYGKVFEGIFRTTVLIGADGRILKIWRNVKVDGHADDVLAAAHAL
jgi:peroxiredoxin Q/BCP